MQRVWLMLLEDVEAALRKPHNYVTAEEYRLLLKQMRDPAAAAWTRIAEKEQAALNGQKAALEMLRAWQPPAGLLQRHDLALRAADMLESLQPEDFDEAKGIWHVMNTLRRLASPAQDQPREGTAKAP